MTREGDTVRGPVAFVLDVVLATAANARDLQRPERRGEATQLLVEGEPYYSLSYSGRLVHSMFRSLTS